MERAVLEPIETYHLIMAAKLIYIFHVITANELIFFPVDKEGEAFRRVLCEEAIFSFKRPEPFYPCFVYPWVVAPACRGEYAKVAAIESIDCLRQYLFAKSQ